LDCSTPARQRFLFVGKLDHLKMQVEHCDVGGILSALRFDETRREATLILGLSRDVRRNAMDLIIS
jgi:hypothetical protein